MGNTKEGAKKALETLRQRYGDNYQEFTKTRAHLAGKASAKKRNLDQATLSEMGKKSGVARRSKR